MKPLGSNNQQPINNENIIFDVSEDNFVKDVIEISNDKIILVDFWAPWCEPCKQLTPLLEEITKEADGLFSLAKIDIDKNQQLAAQLKIQSIPTVIAFYKKQIVNGFQGVLPKTKIIKFIEQISGKPFPKNKEEFYKSIKDLIKTNDLKTAINNIEDFLSNNSNDTTVIALYIDCLSGLENFKEIKDFIESLSDKLISDKNIQNSINKFKILESASKEPAIELLLSNYNKKPENIENLFKLCDKYFFEKQFEKAFELLLENYSIPRNKNKEEVKKVLIKYFDALGATHEQTKIYRRKLSSLIFS